MHISAYTSIFRHIQAFSGITQAYSGPFVNLKYSEPWHIENQRYIQNPGIFRVLGYWEHRHIQNPDILRTWDIFRNLSNIYDVAFCKTSCWCNYFWKSLLFWQYQFFIFCTFWNKYSIMNFCNAGLIFTPEVYILCKKS